jgi:hypothetical protein
MTTSSQARTLVVFGATGKTGLALMAEARLAGAGAGSAGD